MIQAPKQLKMQIKAHKHMKPGRTFLTEKRST